MLEGLDAINWHELSHCFGPADDVPDLIRGVASKNQGTRDKAWDALHGNLWHQGSVYEATPHAVPFFVELAENPQVPERDRVLDYLVHLAKGKSFADVHQHAGLFSKRKGTPEFERRLETELAWARATREAVRAARRVFGALLDDGQAVVRMAAAHLLTQFPEHAAEHIAWIRARLARGELDEKCRTWCVIAVGKLDRREASAASWLEAVLASGAPEAVRIAAALSLAWSRGRALPEAARELISREARNPGPAAALFEGTSWHWGDDVLQFSCSEALGLVRDLSDQSIDSLIGVMNEVAPYQAVEIMRSLLGRVFAGKPMAPTMTADLLSADQRRVLEAVLVCPKIKHGANGRIRSQTVIDIMKEFGLPPNVLRLQAFLQGRAVSQDSEWSSTSLVPATPSPEMVELMRKVSEEVKGRQRKPRDRGSGQDQN